VEYERFDSDEKLKQIFEMNKKYFSINKKEILMCYKYLLLKTALQIHPPPEPIRTTF
jgi:hypothetical protein